MLAAPYEQVSTVMLSRYHDSREKLGLVCFLRDHAMLPLRLAETHKWGNCENWRECFQNKSVPDPQSRLTGPFDDHQINSGRAFEGSPLASG